MGDIRPWQRVFLEGVVIVGSILLAFGIDAWWEGLGARAGEREALAALHTELSTNRDALTRSMAQIETHRAELERFLVHSPSNVGQMADDSIEFEQIFRRTFFGGLASGFADATMNSNIIRDTNLRAALAQHQRDFSALINTWENVDDLSREALQLLGRHRGLQAPGSQPDAQLWEDLRADSVLVGIARAKWTYWGNQYFDSARLLTQIDVLVSMIESRLGPT